MRVTVDERFAVRRKNRKHEQRNAQVWRLRGIGSGKAGRGDADDFHREIIDKNFFADDMRIAAESLLPEEMAQHDRGRARPNLIVGSGTEDPSERGSDTE